MEKPKAQRMGKPFCDREMLYLIQENGGTIKRIELKKKLEAEGYSKYCIYEAFRQNDWRKKIIYEGDGHSPNQLIHLSETYEED